MNDMTIINNYRLYKKAENLEGVYRLSADVNDDNSIDIFDITMINNYRLFKTGL